MTSEISFTFNAEQFTGNPGQSIAAALIASDRRVLRNTRFNQEPRSIFCGIGICFDCVVVIDGVANQRSCLVEISDGMIVESSQ